MTDLAVLGAGAFGTALAIALSRDGSDISLVTRTAEGARALDDARVNTHYLPDAPFPNTLRITHSLAETAAQTVLITVPMQALALVTSELARDLAGRRLVACCKGIDLATKRGPTAVLEEACPDATIAILTGPSFAADIGLGLPTALTLACSHAEAGEALQVEIARSRLRLYLSQDVIGAELGGALKNVIALAAGLTIGAGLGESARASVITRGFAEMERIATALGADPATLSGLSGLGDLILTCTSEKSRNFSAGLKLGAGDPLPQNKTIEGVATARAMADLAKTEGIDAPLTSMVAAVLDGTLTIAAAEAHLLARPLRTE